MKIARSLVAFILCFCLVVVLSNSVLVEAKYNHSSFIKKAERKLKQKKYKGIEILDDFVYANGKKGDIYIHLMKNAKQTKKYYKIWLGNLIHNSNYYESFSKKNVDKNTVWMTDKNNGYFECCVFKKNTKKCRIYEIDRSFKHKPKAKKLRKIKKSIIKEVNAFDRL
ncbi:MAG: hypothetical protein IJ889_04210 [Eubacterium sp.]|nr:hypothetical protein [Eubacterium sp.]